MNSYRPVALYDLDGVFQGYGILGEHKLQSLNIYREGEEANLNEQIARLNQKNDLTSHWPHPQDPEVVNLLDDPAFMPIEYEDREVIDDDSSFLVWKQEPEVDSFGNATGQTVNGTEYDPDVSVIRYKLAKVPKRPTDVMWRIKSACEQVARQRSGLL